MFRPTDPQLSLMESRFLVSPAKRERLENSWAQAFRDRVLPLIDEEAFRSCFHEDNGRPNKSIRLLVGMHLLKEADDLTDEQILDAVEFNIQWQHALGVQPEDAHVCEKTLHNFRHKLMDNDRAQVVFQQLTEALMRADGLSSVRQRLDSTHVMSNIRVLTRLGLFTETVTAFLRELRKEAPEKLAALPCGYAERYLDREGYFAGVKREQAQRRLPVVARDLYALMRAFEGDEVVREWASYKLLVRILEEQCDVVGDEGGERVEVKDGKEVGGDSLQSPHDPDATYGHKGKGYEAQVTETCAEGNPYQLITDVRINGAHESDQHATAAIVDDLHARGIGPEELLADTGYSSGDNIIQCAEAGTELVAPVQDPAAPEPTDARWEQPVAEVAEAPRQAEAAVGVDEDAPIGLEAFAFNPTCNEVVACPVGEVPVRHAMNDTAVAFEAIFDAAACARCPLAARCPTRLRNDGTERVLKWRDVRAATAHRQQEQRRPEFKDRYRLRSGIESTNAELKVRHGARKLRVRRRSRVELTIALKALALNAKRAVQHHTERLRAAGNGRVTIAG